MSGVGRSGVQAQTSPDATDRRLRGRTYAIPFEEVWQASLRLTGGGVRGWTRVAADDDAGLIEAQARRITGAWYDIVIEIRLDEDAQTRVDGRVAARRPGTDFGTSARLLRRFFGALDRALARRPRPGYASRP